MKLSRKNQRISICINNVYDWQICILTQFDNMIMDKKLRKVSLGGNKQSKIEWMEWKYWPSNLCNSLRPVLIYGITPSWWAIWFFIHSTTFLQYWLQVRVMFRFPIRFLFSNSITRFNLWLIWITSFLHFKLNKS